MKKLEFKNWLKNEVSTSTANVAVFARPIFGQIVKRKFPEKINLITKKCGNCL